MPFVDEFEQMQAAVHKTAKDKGFWDHDFNFGEKVALIHSELSEMLEAHRDGTGNQLDSKLVGTYFSPTNLEVEAADVIIRLMDLGEHLGWNIAQTILSKMKYNATRPPKHGKGY